MIYNLPQRILLGLAIGDALGAATEFSSVAGAKRRVKQLAYYPGSPFGFAPGEATDDTQMTIAGLIATRQSLPASSNRVIAGDKALAYARACHRAFARWAASSPPDIGGQTARACGGSLLGVREVYESTAVAGRAPGAGNGGLMRAAAPFLAGLRGRALLSATAIHTAVTHYEPRCIMDAVAFAHILDLAELSGEPLTSTVRLARENLCLSEGDFVGIVVSALSPAFGLDASDHLALTEALSDAARNTADAILGGVNEQFLPPTGYTTSTLQNALAHTVWAYNTAESQDNPDVYGKAILSAARAGGDSDTIGCVAGALAAAFDREALARPQHAALVAGLRVGHAWADWQYRAAPAAERLLALVDPACAGVAL